MFKTKILKKKPILLLIFIAFLYSTTAFAQLAAGDIAFIGYNTDHLEGYSFITLTTIPPNEKIYFTDKGVKNAGAWGGTIESTFLFTAPAAGIPCGTVVNIIEAIQDSNILTISGITGATMTLSSGIFNLGSGDQMFAYQYTGPGEPPTPGDATFIAGLTSEYEAIYVDTNGWTKEIEVSSTSESALPPGLTNGLNALSITPLGPEFDNFKYAGTLTGTASVVRAAINNYNNWTINNNNGPAPIDISPGVFSSAITCPPPCTAPDIPTVTYTPASFCIGATITLNIAGNLNDATQWAVYTGSCGGTLVGTTTSTSINVTPPSLSTIYYVRGEGGCVTPGSCGTAIVNALNLDNVAFSYSAASYCTSASDPTPTITGLTGGTFSSIAGLSINAATGAVDLSVSTPGIYAITYTTAGTCPNSSTVSLTVNALDDASYNYSAASYCTNTSDPTPTITGLTGGTFSSTAGLAINAGTGAVDLSTSTPNTYTITYTTAGTCPNSSSTTFTVNALDDASFSYSAASYCANASDPSPTIIGLAGGAFSSTAGLAINAATGAVDLSASTPNTYTITYTTTGTCPNFSTTSLTVNTLDNASFSYSAATYCTNATDPTPTITGLPGGSFSSTAGLSLNAGTGAVDVSTSIPSTYTITYTTAGTCPNSSTTSLTVNALDNASFSYSASSYCANATDPTPTITGLAGGTFSSTAGLAINAATGAVDLSASTPNIYTITYTTAGTCPNFSTTSLTVNTLDNASFSYSAATYCTNATDPNPTITGLTGGAFSSTAGLAINAATGAVDLSTSTAGTYTITYTTAGTCPNSSSTTFTVNALDNASFSYSTAAYCVNATDPNPTITGLTGGSFSSTAGLAINPASGAVDLSASTSGTYTITYTTAGTCPNSSNTTFTVNTLDDASFNYIKSSYNKVESNPTPTITGVASGSFSSTPSGLVINATTGEITLNSSDIGTYTITYTSPNTPLNCQSSSNTSIQITNAPLITPVITFTNSTKTYGDPNFDLAATSNSSGTISYSIVGTANGTGLTGTDNKTVDIGNAGTVIIRASQIADGIYTTGTKDIILTVQKAVLTATADDKSRAFEEANPTFSISYSGFVNGDTEAGLNMPITASSTATSSSNSGTYTIELTGGSASNYIITTVNGTLTITSLLATINTNAVDNITTTTATFNADVIFTGGEPTIISGFVYSPTNTSPTLSDFKTETSVGLGSFSEVVTGLTSDTKYYVGAYVTNSFGTSYGDVIEFTTYEEPSKPRVSQKKKYGFSPNGDGINDTWVIANIENYPNNTVKVFNRSGKLIYEQKAYKNTWNGVANTIGGNQKLPVGPYLFIIELNNANEKPVQGWLYINY